MALQQPLGAGMALVSCPECGAQVASKAQSCPQCGEPDPSRRARNGNVIRRVVGLIVVLVAGSYLWFVQIPALKNSFGTPSSTQQR